MPLPTEQVGGIPRPVELIDAVRGECPRICVGTTELEGHAHYEGDTAQDRCEGGSLEMHLTSAYRKLDVRSRRDLSAALDT